MQQFGNSDGVDMIPVDELALLKEAIKEASKTIRAIASRRVAQTTAHRLAITLSFIRLVESQEYRKAEALQGKYERLSCSLSLSTTLSEEFKNIKNHAIELMHTDISERSQELKAARHGLAEEVYKRRKDGIARRLRRLLPAGACSEVSVLKDHDGLLQTEPANIAQALTLHWQQVFNEKATGSKLRENGWKI